MVSSRNVPTDNLDSQGSILPSYSKELEEYCQFSVADEVNAIVYIGFACFEIYSRPNSPRSSSLRSMAVMEGQMVQNSRIQIRSHSRITITFNDHIRIQDIKINQIQQASRSYSRSYITFNMNIPDIHIQHIEN